MDFYRLKRPVSDKFDAGFLFEMNNKPHKTMTIKSTEYGKK